MDKSIKNTKKKSPSKNEIAAKIDELSNDIRQGKIDEEDMEMLIKFLETKEKRSKLDKDLLKTLKNTFSNNALDNTNENYKKIMKELKDQDMVLYFKDADKLVLYDTTNVMDMLIKFSHAKNMYEVVDNNKPQKIKIVSDSSIKPDIKKMKKIIVDFINKKEIEVDPRDIYVFEHENQIEFIITSLYVNNEDEKTKFTNDLIKYINRNVENSRKIVKNLTEKMYELDANNELDNVTSNYIAMSENDKKLLEFKDKYQPKQILRDADMFKKLLISYVKGCKNLNGATVNINVNMVNTVNVEGDMHMGDNNTNIGIDPYKYIISELKKRKPTWYKCSKELLKTDVYKNFKDEFPTIINSSKTFWTNMQNKIVKEENKRQINGIRNRYIKLKKIW